MTINVKKIKNANFVKNNAKIRDVQVLKTIPLPPTNYVTTYYQTLEEVH